MKVRLERVGLVAGMILASLNIWTGAPLLGLWIGSRVTGGEQITMLAVAVTALAMLAACLALVVVLGQLSARHDALSGHTPTVRRHTPWLRSMSGERQRDAPGAPGHELNALEYVVVSMAVLAVLAFEVWFFLFSGSPFDQRTGRE